MNYTCAFNLPSSNEKVTSMIMQFLHTFPRPSDTPSYFSPYDEHYRSYFHQLIGSSVLYGLFMFLAVLVLLMRRWKYAQDDAFAFRYALSTDIPTVLLLGIMILSALGGLLSEARLDYAVHVTSDAMMNTSNTFEGLQHNGIHMHSLMVDLSTSAADLMTSTKKNQSEIMPPAMMDLLTTSTQLRQWSLELNDGLHALPTDVVKSKEREWKKVYAYLKQSTNGVITWLVMAGMLAIVAVGWSISSPIRWALILALWSIPMAYTLVGVYMSGAIAGADFCVQPENSTLSLFTPLLNSSLETELFKYYTLCPIRNGTTPTVFDAEPLDWTALASTTKDSHDDAISSPFDPLLVKLHAHAVLVQKDINALVSYGRDHPTYMPRMEKEYLLPMEAQLAVFQDALRVVENNHKCDAIKTELKKATDVFCTEGVIGTFSLWIHQMVLCLLVIMCIVCMASVWERVEARRQRMEVQYTLLGSYEGEDADHVYLSPE